MSELYIGLMSGTSVDGIDAVLVDFSHPKPTLLASHYTPYQDDMRQSILALCMPGTNEIDRMGECDHKLGVLFAHAVQTLLANANCSAHHIKAIGSHGQTIRHRPDMASCYTLQIGDPNMISALTGITTIADFRRRDMAHGGQGAPLVPAFHQAIFYSHDTQRAIINIGGIANATLLTNTSSPLLGFDTGPGNALMDAWMYQHHQKNHDAQGKWAASGQINHDLLTLLMSDDYFKRTPPKSTGREYFNLEWLQARINQLNHSPSPHDIQCTLAELTAHSIADTVAPYINQGEWLICGGGAHNDYLMSRINALAPHGVSVHTTEAHGLHPDWIEATAFAWLAKQTLQRQPGNLPSVTGAKKPAILGGVYYAEEAIPHT